MTEAGEAGLGPASPASVILSGFLSVDRSIANVHARIASRLGEAAGNACVHIRD
jgi:hypothetical protein